MSKRICTIYLHTGLICFHFEMELIYHLLLSVERLTFDFDSSIEREKGNRISFQIADSQNIQNWLESVGNTTHDNLRIFCSFSFTLQTDGINTVSSVDTISMAGDTVRPNFIADSQRNGCRVVIRFHPIRGSQLVGAPLCIFHNEFARLIDYTVTYVHR